MGYRADTFRPTRHSSALTPPRRPVLDRAAPDCPSCSSDQHVVIYRPAGVPWYGGPWRPRSWRCVSCHANFTEVLARTGTAG